MLGLLGLMDHQRCHVGLPSSGGGRYGDVEIGFTEKKKSTFTFMLQEGDLVHVCLFMLKDCKNYFILTIFNLII